MRRQVENEVKNSWKSWEHIAKSRIENIEYLLDQIRNDFSLCGLSFKDSDEWLDTRVRELQLELREDKRRSREFKAV